MTLILVLLFVLLAVIPTFAYVSSRFWRSSPPPQVVSGTAPLELVYPADRLFGRQVGICRCGCRRPRAA